MVSTGRWWIGSDKRPYNGIHPELYVICNFIQFTYISNIQSQIFVFNFNNFLPPSADKVKNAGNITLLALMLLAIYNHWMVNDVASFERIGSALVFTFMLTGRLVVWYQISRREAKLNAATQAQANGLKQD